MSTLRTMEADSSPDADSASADSSNSDPTPLQQTPQQHATQEPNRQAVQTRRQRLPSSLERNGIAAAVITSFAALLVYGFMSLSNQIENVEDNLNQRIDRVDQRITTEIAAVRDDMNQWIDRVDARFAQIDQRFIQIEGRLDQIDQRFIQIDSRFAQIDQRLTDINAILFDHTGRLSRIETTLELGSDATPQT